MSEDKTKKRTLNQMDGFKRGFEATLSLKSIYEPIQDHPDEYLAFALGAIAAIYNSTDDRDKLWEIRKKVWQVEEALGESRKDKLE